MDASETMDRNNLTAKRIREFTGISQSQARRYAVFLQCDAPIREAINQGRLDNVSVVELICSAKQVEQRQQLLAAALANRPFSVIAAMKKAFDLASKQKIVVKGRPKSSVMLGRLKPDVVKEMVSALADSQYFSATLSHQIKQIKQQVLWENSEQAEKGFKEILALIDKGRR